LGDCGGVVDGRLPVYVVHFREAGIQVYADRDEALAAQPTDWMWEYARHSGAWMHVRPDPTGYETRDVAPGPETGAIWSDAAMRMREARGSLDGVDVPDATIVVDVGPGENAWRKATGRV